MNKTLMIAILIVILGGGYYFYTSGNTVSNTVDGAMEAATETATDAVEEGAQAVTETVTDAVTDAVTETVPESMDGALFSAEGFDAVKIGDMIDASSLDESQKSGFKTALQSAMDDPAMLTNILGQLKEALGV